MASTCGSGPSGIDCRIASVPGEIAGNALSSGADSAMHSFAESMATSAEHMLETLTKMWMSVSTPSLTGGGSPVTVIQNGVQWITLSVAVVCVLVAAGRMAIRRRGEPFSAMAFGLVRLIVVSAAAASLVELAGRAGDELSTSLMNYAHLGTVSFSSSVNVTSMVTAFGGGDGILMIVSLVVLLAALVQLMLMVLRIGLLIILTGTLPLAAAASMSDWGETWWRKHLGWLVAWLLYKPAAALFFAGAVSLTHGKQSLVVVAAGFMLLISMVLLLPAMLKMIVPATSALGAASGGGLAMAATGAIATGAIRIGSGGLGAVLGAGAAKSRSSGSGTADGDSGTGDDTPTGTGSTVANPVGGSNVAEDAGQGDGPSGVTEESAERPSGDSSGLADSGTGADSPSTPSDSSDAPAPGAGLVADDEAVPSGGSPEDPMMPGPGSGDNGGPPAVSGNGQGSGLPSGFPSGPASGATGQPPDGPVTPAGGGPEPPGGSQPTSVQTPATDGIQGPSGSAESDAPAENGG